MGQKTMKVAMTGASGQMGREVLRETLTLPEVEWVRLLLTPRKRNDKLAKKLKKKYGGRIEVVRGKVSDRAACAALVEGADYVVHMAGVIPPAADEFPERSEECNRRGAVALIDAVKACSPQPKYSHISTVAVYGGRNEKHPFGRVGDPLLVAAYDRYAMDKLFAERYCLDAELENWVILRETAMLHPDMMANNISDGLIFHITPNSPLEWVSARDSGYLIRRILERDHAGEVPTFWKKIYDVGGGKKGRETGYDTFDDGFAMIGGSTEKFIRPHWLAARNFHGLWFYDADELEALFSYQRDGVKAYWQEIAKGHKIYALGRLVPAKLIDFFLFRRLLRHPNSPRRWVEEGDRARVTAAYGSPEAAAALSHDWKDYPLLAKGDFGDYDALRDEKNAVLLSHGYDESKPLERLEIGELRAAAAFRGGECLAEAYDGDPYKKLPWRCHDGHLFETSVYTVLKGGHWCPVCHQPAPWDFDRIAKFSPFVAQVWYDSHGKDEDLVYDLEEGRPTIRKVGEKA